MRKSSRFAALLALLTLALVAVPALGQEGAAAEGPERFNGTWRYANRASAGRATIERAITAAVDGMNFITQPIASGRLRDKNPLVQRFEITLSDSSCRVVFDGRRTYRGALDAWTEHTFGGDSMRVQFRQRGDAVTQLFRSDGGTRRNVYRLLPNGRMRLEVNVHSGSLPRDMNYRLTYRR